MKSELVSENNINYIVMDSKSFWRKSILNLECLYSILKTPAPRKVSFETLASNSPYKPNCDQSEKILRSLFEELPNLKTSKGAVSEFLYNLGGSYGFKTALSNPTKRKSIGLSV